ncbi:MAG: hypothetical protein ACPGSL_06195 [Vicingaceae bacterium]
MKSPKFTAVLKYIQANPHACKMKERNDKLTLIFENVGNVREAIGLLEPIV